MGSFKAEISFSTTDEIFTTSFFKTDFGRSTNRVGKTTTGISGINLEFRTPSSVSTALVEAMVICEHTHFDVSVSTYASDSTGKQKTWDFKDCVMTGFSDSFNSDSAEEATTWCRITANTMTCGPAEITSNWVNT